MPFQKINVEEIVQKELENKEFKDAYIAVRATYELDPLSRAIAGYEAMSEDNPYREIARMCLLDILEFESRK